MTQLIQFLSASFKTLGSSYYLYLATQLSTNQLSCTLILHWRILHFHVYLQLWTPSDVSWKSSEHYQYYYSPNTEGEQT